MPEPFTFAIKASQRITHFARLKPEAQSALEFLLKNTESLGERLGPILFQLPPNMKKDVPRLKAFLEMLPADRRYTIEFRHETWFDDETYDTLRARDIPMCIIEQPEFASPVVATASWGYLRLHRFDYDGAMHGIVGEDGSAIRPGATRTSSSSTTRASAPARRPSTRSTRV